MDWVVLNCPATAILGRYHTEEEAAAAAARLGRCSFPYHLSEQERRALDTEQAQPTQEGAQR